MGKPEGQLKIDPDKVMDSLTDPIIARLYDWFLINNRKIEQKKINQTLEEISKFNIDELKEIVICLFNICNSDQKTIGSNIDFEDTKIERCSEDCCSFLFNLHRVKDTNIFRVECPLCGSSYFAKIERIAEDVVFAGVDDADEKKGDE